MIDAIPNGAEASHLKEAVLKTSWPGATTSGAPEFAAVTIDGTARIDELVDNMVKEKDEIKIGMVYLNLLDVLQDHGILDKAQAPLTQKIQTAMMPDKPEQTAPAGDTQVARAKITGFSPSFPK